MQRLRPYLLDDPTQRRVFTRTIRRIGGQLIRYLDGRIRYIAPNMRSTTVEAGEDPTRRLRKLGVRI